LSPPLSHALDLEPRIAIDGRFVPPEAAVISVLDRGFLYGDSVFETVRTYGGKIFELDAHLERLERSFGIVGMQAPIETAALRDEMVRLGSEALAHFRAKDPAAEVSLRVMFTRGAGPLGLLPKGQLVPRRVLFAALYIPPSAVAYREGIRVICVPTYRPSDAAPGAKVGNYLESLLALQRARENEANEALIVDGTGHVLEGTTSNVFMVRAGSLLTPPLDRILAGVTRATVIALAREANYPLEEVSLRPEDLRGASEVFITSTLRGVMPVRAVDDSAIAMGPITADLSRRYEDHARL
jgi:branched-chain amino acid aminotransferase